MGEPIKENIDLEYVSDTRSIMSMWTGFKGMDEAYLNKFNRTSQYRGVKYQYDSNQDPLYTMKPFIWRDFIYDKSGTQVSYRSFKECFEDMLLPSAFL